MYHIHLQSTQATKQTALSTGQCKNCRKYKDHMGRDQAKGASALKTALIGL
jgi:hypothetical protein